MIKLLLQNSISNVTLTIVKLGIAFIMSPVVVRALGNHDYGIFEMLLAIIGYMGILDIGLQPAIVRYVAKYSAINDQEKLRSVYSSALFFMGILGCFIFLVLIFWAFIDPTLLVENKGDETKYFCFLLIVGFQMLITFPGYVFGCFHEGYQRYHLKNAVNMITSIIGCSIIYLLLRRGGGLLTFAVGNTAMTCVNVITYWILLRLPKFGKFHFERKYISRESFKELFKFGSSIMVLGIADRISTATDSIVIGAFLGPVLVTFYAIPMNLIRYLSNFTTSITLGFMPFFSGLDARGERVTAGRVFLLSSRYVGAAVLLFFVGTAFLGIPFIKCWMGAEYGEKGRWVLYYLLAAFSIPLMNPFAGRFLTGIGRQAVVIKYLWPSAILNLTLSVILVQSLGIEGAALSTLIATVIFQPLILREVCKYAGISMSDYLSSVLLPLLGPGILLASLLFVLINTMKVDSYIAILGIASLGSAAYLISFLLLAVKENERNFLLARIRSVLALI